MYKYIHVCVCVLWCVLWCTETPLLLFGDHRPFVSLMIFMRAHNGVFLVFNLLQGHLVGIMGSDPAERKLLDLVVDLRTPEFSKGYGIDVVSKLRSVARHTQTSFIDRNRMFVCASLSRRFHL